MIDLLSSFVYFVNVHWNITAAAQQKKNNNKRAHGKDSSADTAESLTREGGWADYGPPAVRRLRYQPMPKHPPTPSRARAGELNRLE
ncbi:hypothetical protein NHX12_023375 [Muraenolepis orangiensis]|uniref:Uncharacterized protein n=1 Tax=Muraenolepis orangiensis TaxID=630683 RepID=A0A9Q0ISQ0_9TELE|nr:hypothetical protein NHX12_023375 [Muraenolepis orangiensis]